MNADLIPFAYDDRQVRTVQIDGEPWFVAADVVVILEIGRVHDAVRGLDEDERGTDTIRTPGGDQQVSIVNESGLYSLILRSRKPEAKKFKRWVTHEVIPAIRKTGRYEVQRTELPAFDLSNLDSVAQLVQAAGAAVELARHERSGRLAAEAQVAELAPDAARAKRTMDADGLALVGTVAKRFGIKSKALREFLYAEGLLIRLGNRHNEPYARYIESGHFELKTRLVDVDPDRAPQERSTTFVTPKGEALIWKRLYDAGYVTSPTQPPRQLQLVGIDGGAA